MKLESNRTSQPHPSSSSRTEARPKPSSSSRTETRPNRRRRKRRVDFRVLHKKLEQTLAHIAGSDEVVPALKESLNSIVRDFRDDLGFLAGRLYMRRGKVYRLLDQSGRGPKVEPQFTVSANYKPIERLIHDGYIFSREGDPDFDQRIERPLGIRAYAAIVVGERNRYLISFTLRRRFPEEQITYALNTIRHVINIKIQQLRLEDIIWEASEIQVSMLPREAPRFKGFDICGRSVPADVVGGDLFDYTPISDRILGVAIADSRGHGLPAALQARDVIVGLRMGGEEHFKIVTTVEKLNRVIARSALATQFVSLFYGELEENGNLIYCNAGHQPGLLLRGDRFTELHEGGLILGPDPQAKYQRGFCFLKKGDLLLLYTDGVVEARSPSGEEFGVPQLRRLLLESRDLSARELSQLILSRVEHWCQPRKPADDHTVLVIRRTA
jgi:sigma-B regulation protein RsbU (phosphoserine phosphatase)